VLDSGFTRAFHRSAARVRRALGAQGVLDGISAGAAAGAVAAVGLWATGRSGGALAAAAFAAAGALAGLWMQRRHRWSDQDVALFLDARLTRTESISTALERSAATDDVSRRVVEDATRTLDASPVESARPRILRRRHAALPVAVVALGVLPLLPPRVASPGPATAAKRPADTVTRSLDGLRRVEALRDVETLGADERRRLEGLATAARELDARGREGVERKEALDALAKIRDGVNAEQGRLAEAKNRAGLDAAARALASHPETRDAARALGNADLRALDREMAKLADSAEKAARKAAIADLEEASHAARQRAAEDVAQALDEQQHLLQHRAATSDALRELARLLEGTLPPEARRALEHLERSADAKGDAFAQALAEALEGLTPEERARLVKSFQRKAEEMQADGSPSRGEMERLLHALSTKEGREELRTLLKKLATTEPSTAHRRDDALAMAQVGLDDAQRALTSEPSEMGPLGTKQDPNAPSIGNQASGASSPSGPTGTHAPPAAAPAASAFAARAPGHGTSGGVYAGKAEGFAPPVGSPAPSGSPAAELSIAAPREIGAVERSNVPKQYQDQVRRYFTP
jgi:hypothetical protein